MEKYMKLSKTTVGILKNFASINTNLLIKSGNKLSTIGGQKAIFAEVTAAEKFPLDFAIYDLNAFLSAYSLFQDPELQFTDKFVSMTEGGSIKYFAANAAILTVPTKEITMPPNPEIRFDLSENMLANIIKTSSILSAPDVSFIGDGSEIRVVVSDKKNATANSYDTVIGDTKLTFKINLKVENFKFIPGNYSVLIGSNAAKTIKRSKFMSKNSDLFYIMSVEIDSVI